MLQLAQLGAGVDICWCFGPFGPLGRLDPGADLKERFSPSKGCIIGSDRYSVRPKFTTLATECYVDWRCASGRTALSSVSPAGASSRVLPCAGTSPSAIRYQTAELTLFWSGTSVGLSIRDEPMHLFTLTNPKKGKQQAAMLFLARSPSGTTWRLSGRYGTARQAGPAKPSARLASGTSSCPAHASASHFRHTPASSPRYCSWYQPTSALQNLTAHVHV